MGSERTGVCTLPSNPGSREGSMLVPRQRRERQDLGSSSLHRVHEEGGGGEGRQRGLLVARTPPGGVTGGGCGQGGAGLMLVSGQGRNHVDPPHLIYPPPPLNSRRSTLIPLYLSFHSWEPRTGPRGFARVLGAIFPPCPHALQIQRDYPMGGVSSAEPCVGKRNTCEERHVPGQPSLSNASEDHPWA